MTIHPERSWQTPAASWDEVIDRYVRHRQVPTWRGATHNRQGNKLRDRLDQRDAEKIRTRIHKHLNVALQSGHLPPKPYPLSPRSFEALLDARRVVGRAVTKCPEWLQDLRKAVVLNAAGYTCAYCGRTAWGVFEEEKRTLRFEMDHRTAKALIANCNDFDMASIVAACRSCNVMKGQMTEAVFRKELESLARAVVAQVR